MRAVEFNPNHATAHHGYFYSLLSRGRLEEARVEARWALVLDPFSLIFPSGARLIL